MSDVDFKRDIDGILHVITSFADSKGVAAMCDMSHKEGPWLVGRLEAPMAIDYMLSYNHEGTSPGLQAMGFIVCGAAAGHVPTPSPP
jgi:hypothetical protein